MGEFCLLMMDSSYVVYTTKYQVDYNLWRVFQEDGLTLQSGEVTRGRVCCEQGYSVQFFYVNAFIKYLEDIRYKCYQ